MSKSIIALLTLSLFLFFGSLPGLTQDAAPAHTTETKQKDQATQDAKKKANEALIVERVQVLGSEENARKTPGSAHYISKKDLEKQDYTDIHRILRQVPGINIQEEEGYGLRPNIGLRGTGVERSQKITLMEDGVLIAPAPYTAPAAYYFPTAGRMESIEVLKGSSSTKYGPFTNGGSLNLISTSIPGRDFSAKLDMAGGSDSTQRYKASIGGGKTRFGWLVEGFKLNTDGFKTLDNGGDTGVELEDFTGKFRFNSAPEAAVYQSLELKLGKTEQFGHETYLGLTEPDYALTPNRRYAASQDDFIDTDHDQVQLRYFIKPNANMDITTTVYNNDYFRNWHKLERVNGISNSSILNDPESFGDELAILRGERDSAPGALTVRNNRRNYYKKKIA